MESVAEHNSKALKSIVKRQPLKRPLKPLKRIVEEPLEIVSEQSLETSKEELLVFDSMRIK
jgi:hypothetical protein